MTIQVAALALLTSISVSDEIDTSLPTWTEQSYGDDMLFTVKREGKKIGTHSVSFSTEGDKLIVDTETKLKVKFLFITAYRFKYTAREIWQNGQISQISANTNANGKKFTYEMKFNGNNVSVDDGATDTVFELEAAAFPSNHWNPNVLRAPIIMNTLSGSPNTIEITPLDWETRPTAEVSRRAQGFEYSGELNDVVSWYDERGRWVGLEFKGEDGSTITYECVRCGTT